LLLPVNSSFGKVSQSALDEENESPSGFMVDHLHLDVVSAGGDFGIGDAAALYLLVKWQLQERA
jgi:hypothetical protein